MGRVATRFHTVDSGYLDCLRNTKQSILRIPQFFYVHAFTLCCERIGKASTIMHQLSDQQLSPTLVVKALLANGFFEFQFADLHQAFRPHFPLQSSKTIYQSLYRVVDRFVKKGYLARKNSSDQPVIYQQTDLLRVSVEHDKQKIKVSEIGHLAAQIRENLAGVERELWVTSSAADQCQQKIKDYPLLRQQLSRMQMEYREKSLSKLAEVEVLRRLLTECGGS